VRREAETHAAAARDGRAPPGLGARRAETLGLRSPYESPDPDGSEQCFRRDAGNDLASNSSVLIEVTWTAKPNRKRLLPNPVAWAVATLASGHSRPLEGHTSWVHAVAFSLDGWHIVSGSADKTLRLYEVASGRELGRFDGDGAFLRPRLCPPCERLRRRRRRGTRRPGSPAISMATRWIFRAHLGWRRTRK
jgi:hypothetical protein